MKLNYKNTFLCGLAFFTIMSFWQLYDNVIPLLLTNTFGLAKSYTGYIMAADDVLALFLLPLFGKISDGTRSRYGRRMPYIVIGTVIAAALLNLIPIIDNGHAAGNGGIFFSLPAFIAVLGILLVTMSVYRSPAVALMPDITPKPLRSQGNAIINLMGAAGGITYLVFAAVMYPASKTENVGHVDYAPLFIFMSVIMVVAIVIMFKALPEKALFEKNEKIEKEHPEWDLTEKKDESGKSILPPEVKRSMIFLLLSVALWYMAYNSVTTWFTTYIDDVMGKGLGGASLCFLIANGGAVISYIPLGIIASKIGRKKSIYFGTVLLTVCFGSCYFLTTMFTTIKPITYAVFALIGLAWAAINVNSLPMCLEMCKGSDSGKFTGYYYALSMSGQILTPILSGYLMEMAGVKCLFVYAAVFALMSFLTMTLVKHGDVLGDSVKGLEAFEDFDS